MPKPVQHSPPAAPLWTIDTLAHLLAHLFSPIPWLSVFLTRRALSYPWHSTVDSLALVLCILCLAAPAIRAFSDRLAWGPPRRVHLDEEIVVITGGSSGLGRIIADTYAMRGAAVAVLDVVPYHREGTAPDGSDVHWYETDVGSEDAVMRAKREIEAALGPPTTLINNAGIVNGKPLLEIESSALTRNFNVNLLAHFYTIRAFLPGMISRRDGGTIVTVSSVLGDLGASQLSDYTAAKAALIAMHTSLRAELDQQGHQHVKTILVKPGQLSTPLFRGVQTPSGFFGPVVEPVTLARKIVKMIDSGRTAVIAMPLYASWIEWMSVLPYDVQKLARWLSGVDRAMVTFKAD